MRTLTSSREQVERMRRRLALLAHPPGPPPPTPPSSPPSPSSPATPPSPPSPTAPTPTNPPLPGHTPRTARPSPALYPADLPPPDEAVITVVECDAADDTPNVHGVRPALGPHDTHDIHGVHGTADAHTVPSAPDTRAARSPHNTPDTPRASAAPGRHATPTSTPAHTDVPSAQPRTTLHRRLLPTVGALPRRVLAVVAAGVVVVAGVVAWLSWPRPEAVTPVGGGVEQVATASAPVVMLVVSVAGEVRRPGLVEVPPGSRVADAIAAAGGVRDPADVGLLNLARKVVDGELIVVGSTATGPGRPGGGAPGAPAVPGANPAPVNLNAATVAELDTLPGVGPVLAQRIVDYRDANGGFTTVDQLRQVDGIGSARFADLKDRVTV
ncbi:ComEA family DNA-binding protein [Phytomonospora sp. NPDC050363]|uniref:ComEA family DNA-binding protein n=1 Tax=Phytomonospora sp. NPDC050363 TaxID=3155642 RepID=UPI00340515D6